MNTEKFTPESLFKPTDKHPNGSSGHIIDEVGGVMVLRVYEGGELVSTQTFTEGPS